MSKEKKENQPGFCDVLLENPAFVGQPVELSRMFARFGAQAALSDPGFMEDKELLDRKFGPEDFDAEFGELLTKFDSQEIDPVILADLSIDCLRFFCDPKSIRILGVMQDGFEEIDMAEMQSTVKRMIEIFEMSNLFEERDLLLIAKELITITADPQKFLKFLQYVKEYDIEQVHLVLECMRKTFFTISGLGLFLKSVVDLNPLKAGFLNDNSHLLPLDEDDLLELINAINEVHANALYYLSEKNISDSIFGSPQDLILYLEKYKNFGAEIAMSQYARHKKKERADNELYKMLSSLRNGLPLDIN